MKKPIGWRNEPGRHALAARGIPTTYRARGVGETMDENQPCEDCGEPVDVPTGYPGWAVIRCKLCAAKRLRSEIYELEMEGIARYPQMLD